MSEYSTVVGIDLGDKQSICVALDYDSGEKIQSSTIASTKAGLTRAFKGWEPALIVIETCGHSRWVSEHLDAMGHEVLVANTRKVRSIYDTDNKSDLRDAETLARLGRFDPKLLYPIKHRGKQAQKHLAVLRARETLVTSRAKLINHVRCTVKQLGERLPRSSSPYFHIKVAEKLPEELRLVLEPLLKTLGQLTEQICHYDQMIERLCEHYPETAVLREISGVGPLTALTFILTLEYPERFEKSRDVAAFLGLTPKRDQSGDTDKQLRITKAGNGYLRKLLVQAAQYILGPLGPDTELRAWGLRLAARGGKNAKKRAVVAVARKLAVLLHRLWSDGAVYEPFYNQEQLEVEHGKA